MTDAIPFPHPLAAREVPPGGRRVMIEASSDERMAVARFLDLRAIGSLTARFLVKPFGRDGLAVEGVVNAAVTQTCVVTGEPIEAIVEEPVALTFSPDGVAFDDMSPDVPDDAPDLMENGRIDLGAIAVEFLALGLDPYPRKQGAEFLPPRTSNDDGEHPFAALKDLPPPRS